MLNGLFGVTLLDIPLWENPTIILCCRGILNKDIWKTIFHPQLKDHIAADPFQIIFHVTHVFPHLNKTHYWRTSAGVCGPSGTQTLYSLVLWPVQYPGESTAPCVLLLATVKPVVCKQTSPNFLWFTTSAGLGRGSFTTSNRPEPASNSSRRQLEHFRFYTSAIFIASLALHAQPYPLERDSLLEAERGRQITIQHTQKRKQVLMKDAKQLGHVTLNVGCCDWTLMLNSALSWLLFELADGTTPSPCLPLRLSKVE